jgi:hypothetical protein
MIYDLTTALEARRRARLWGAIKTAAALIQSCPDPQRQWRAMHELRKLQARLGNPTL